MIFNNIVEIQLLFFCLQVFISNSKSEETSFLPTIVANNPHLTLRKVTDNDENDIIYTDFSSSTQILKSSITRKGFELLFYKVTSHPKEELRVRLRDRGYFKATSLSGIISGKTGLKVIKPIFPDKNEENSTVIQDEFFYDNAFFSVDLSLAQPSTVYSKEIIIKPTGAAMLNQFEVNAPRPCYSCTNSIAPNSFLAQYTPIENEWAKDLDYSCSSNNQDVHRYCLCCGIYFPNSSLLETKHDANTNNTNNNTNYNNDNNGDDN
eukprot:Pgem_evm1s3718